MFHVSKPLVSVITPTIASRHELLLNRCIPSVQAQAYPKVEHVIVSHADPELAGKMAELASGTAFYHPVRLVQLEGPHPGGNLYGSEARLAGIEESKGGYIAYIDDDDALRPEHCAKLAAVLDDDLSLMWAYSLMASHSNSGLSTHIGAPVPAFGQIGTPMIVHRREALEHGTWGPPSSAEDWQLVERWLGAGLPYGRVHEATVDVWPSAYWG